MSGAGKVVCVTGASGYVASWLVKFLLQRRYNVNATVRDLNHSLNRLRNCACGPLFSCIPFSAPAPAPAPAPLLRLCQLCSFQEELIEPAVKGTLNVLRSCKKVPSVKRVVLTSSMAAVMFNSNPLNPDGIVDETCFSDPVFCKEQEQWYCLSKTLAEEVAWKFADENGIDLVVMNPGLVIGPLLQPTLNSTSEMILNIIKEGRTDYPEYSVVDVKDVALAHILAMESPSASGRYCLSGTLLSASEVLKILHKLYPHLNHLQNIAENQHNVNPHPNRVSQEKAKRLGISFTPFEVSLKDIVESLKEKNFLSF
ncbi:tetraketide alpha-pyrone reductase 1-like [Olea europaea subsp. europaea]|uniref:Dihydroflavonol 4-reductase n=1 Tax=Olea europaea subsp. europaea TaxID=158383 RepID=A0A8S0QTC7_OLEEU|nr:tetraketide alpha-pyrone reductase 1-like [Olea europaea subsp. europaea]